MQETDKNTAGRRFCNAYVIFSTFNSLFLISICNSSSFVVFLGGVNVIIYPMKKLTLILFAVMALMVQSCDEWPPGHGGGNGGGSNKPSLVGNWRWISSDGGFFPMTYTPENQGFDAKLALHVDKTYNFGQTDGLQDVGSYIVGTYENRETLRLESASARPQDIMSVARPSNENYIEFFGKDTLVLSGVGADMLTYTYVRVK